ncbi:FAD-binding oxidoreductase, partial [Salinisphaera orenii]|uniref:FAD-binding oxidoreductase n=1 Tax=Salinisphaera orenii TaxID=856731 RepID=UPI0011CEB12B
MKNFNYQSQVPEAAVADLCAALRGVALQPRDAHYDDARAVWNAMIDRRPALIVRALGTSDVIAAVAFAREHRLEIAVKGGGHNVAGSAVCDRGLMLDLSEMISVRVDREHKTARVEPGALINDLD